MISVRVGNGSGSSRNEASEGGDSLHAGANHTQAQLNAALDAFLGMTSILSHLALAADPNLAARCAQELDKITDGLREKPTLPKLGSAGKSALEQMERVRLANEIALQERDEALQQMAAMATSALRAFKGCGDRGGSKLGVVANRFEIISKIEDPHELRRRLRDDVGKLRGLIEDLGKEREKSLQVFESQVSDFRHRLEAARSASDTDPLTNVGSRRAGERALQELAGAGAAAGRDKISLALFDIEDFGEINRNYGRALGDQILKALSSKLHPRFPKPDTLFRWGADEFLAIHFGPVSEARERAESVSRIFAGTTYFVLKDGVKKELSATLAMSWMELESREPVETTYARLRGQLDLGRNSNSIAKAAFDSVGPGEMRGAAR